MGRVEITVIAAIVVAGLFFERVRLCNEVREQKAAVAVAIAERDKARVEKQAVEIGLARAESAKERVREIVRTVTLPPTGVACSEDPAVRGAYDVVRRLRNDQASTVSDSPPAGGVVGAVPAAGAHQ